MNKPRPINPHTGFEIDSPWWNKSQSYVHIDLYIEDIKPPFIELEDLQNV